MGLGHSRHLPRDTHRHDLLSRAAIRGPVRVDDEFSDKPAPRRHIARTGAENETQKDLWKAYQDAAAASREFWITLDQMVLLNLLLPVLTALLGYVFGLKTASKT